MATGTFNVAAKDFCLAAIAKPHLWKHLEKKTFIHKTKGRGRIERVEQPANGVPLIYVILGKETFRINSNILNNGSYRLFLPKSTLSEMGLPIPSQNTQRQLPRSPAREAINVTNRVISPPRCIICKNTCEDGKFLSNGSNYHGNCYNWIIERISTLESHAATLHHHHFGTIVGWLERLFKAASYGNYIETQHQVNNLRAQRKRIWDFWPDYPPDWQERKSYAIAENSCCENCGSSKSLHVHHIIALSNGGSNLAINLAVLCESCHSEAHGGKLFNYRQTSNGTTRITRTTELIQQAIRESRDIVFTYRKYNQPEERRTITPHGFETLAHQRKVGSTYCVIGFCHTRQAERIFKIKNIYRPRLV